MAGLESTKVAYNKAKIPAANNNHPSVQRKLIFKKYEHSIPLIIDRINATTPILPSAKPDSFVLISMWPAS